MLRFYRASVCETSLCSDSSVKCRSTCLAFTRAHPPASAPDSNGLNSLASPSSSARESGALCDSRLGLLSGSSRGRVPLSTSRRRRTQTGKSSKGGGGGRVGVYLELYARARRDC